MGQRGRKSAEAQATAPVAKIGGHRPAPDVGLSGAEQAVWRRLVDSAPADWFHGEHYGLLRQYCRHEARADQLAEAIGRFDPERLTDPDGIKDYNRLTAMAERETRVGMALMRSMRLTHQSQTDPKTAGRAQGGNRPIDWSTIRRKEK